MQYNYAEEKGSLSFYTRVHACLLTRYKERLDLKFMKHGHKSGCLDGCKWTMLAGNMDDFRSGLPAHSPHTPMVVKVRYTVEPLALC